MFNLWIAPVWMFAGLMWLKRARNAEYPGGFTTITAPRDRRMAQRERIIFRLSLGVAYLLTGVANFWVGLHHSH